MLIDGSIASMTVSKSLTMILIFYSLKLYNVLYIAVLPNIIQFRFTLACSYPFCTALKISLNMRIPKLIYTIFS